MEKNSGGVRTQYVYGAGGVVAEWVNGAQPMQGNWTVGNITSRHSASLEAATFH